MAGLQVEAYNNGTRPLRPLFIEISQSPVRLNWMDSLLASEFENLKREFVPYNIDGSTLLIHNFHQYKSLDEVVNILSKYGFVPVTEKES